MVAQFDGPVSLQDVDALIEVLQGQVAHMSGPDASSQLAAVSASAAKLSAYRVALVARVQASEVWRAADPNATPASYLRLEHTLDHREAKADLRAAESFDRFPKLGRACREGKLSRDKMDLILRIGLRNPQREAALPEFLDIFIELAAKATFSQLRTSLELWADQVDPVTSGNDDHDAHQRRELHVHQLGDGVKLDGFFGKEQGLRLMAAINGALSQRWRAENKASADESGLEECKVITSTASQRADAFIEGIVIPVLQSGLLPTSGGALANVCVTVPLGELQHPHEAGDLGDVKSGLMDGTLRLRSATLRTNNGPGEALISADSALLLSCDCTVQRVVLSAKGKPLDIGRKTRVIPEHLRTALIIRDNGCIFPYCDRPPGWTHGHHVQHWSQGGSTSLDNLALLCAKHHHQIHADSIPIRFDAAGIPKVLLEHRYRI